MEKRFRSCSLIPRSVDWAAIGRGTGEQWWMDTERRRIHLARQGPFLLIRAKAGWKAICSAPIPKALGGRRVLRDRFRYRRHAEVKTSISGARLWLCTFSRRNKKPPLRVASVRYESAKCQGLTPLPLAYRDGRSGRVCRRRNSSTTWSKVGSPNPLCVGDPQDRLGDFDQAGEVDGGGYEDQSQGWPGW